LSILEALKYFILGLVQGITEILPISSSGHVELAKVLIGLQEDKGLLFLILVNTGSLVTMLLIYFKKLYRIYKDFFLYIFKKDSRERTLPGFSFGLKIIVATVPIVIVGLLFKDILNQLTTDYNVLLAGVGLLFTGTILILIAGKKILNGNTHINYLDAVLIGVAQSVAIIPGISRSGLTTSTAINRGMGIDSALNFSFMIYIPASIGSVILLIKDSFSEGMGVESNVMYFYYFLAFFAAMVSTYFAYRLIFNIFKSGKIKYFGFYCILIGLLSIGLFIL